MAYTQADLDAIDEAILKLVTFRQPVSFTIDGDVVVYPIYKLSELRSFRSYVAKLIVASDTTARPVNAIRIFG